MSEKLDSILHYGVKRRSGRYPWGSGDEPHRNAIVLTDLHIETAMKRAIERVFGEV